ncbi:MAG: hypothetical protein DRI57_25390 [Deltaproteobacteria bacterium]|nr:MAG: hypothetical protein DRI57_25390 [Deltaproteobacteria bacterium]
MKAYEALPFHSGEYVRTERRYSHLSQLSLRDTKDRVTFVPGMTPAINCRAVLSRPCGRERIGRILSPGNELPGD